MLEKSTNVLVSAVTGRTPSAPLAAFMTPRKKAGRPLEASGRPFERLTVPFDGGELVVHAAGPQEGPRVLLAHGWEGASSQWRDMAAVLVGQGARVFVLDMPGHGESSGQLAHMVVFARAVKAATEALGPMEALAGHSLGGAAVGLASAWGATGARLLLVAPAMEPLTFVHAAARRLGLEGEQVAGLVDELEDYVGYKVSELQVGAALRRTKASVRVVHDPEDVEVPYWHGQGLSQMLLRAELVTVQGVGHRKILGCPEVVADGAAFLLGPRAAQETEAKQSGVRRKHRAKPPSWTRGPGVLPRPV